MVAELKLLVVRFLGTLAAKLVFKLLEAKLSALVVVVSIKLLLALMEDVVVVFIKLSLALVVVADAPML